MRESYYKNILNTLTEFLLRHKPDSTVVYANSAFLKWLGVDREWFIGKKWFDIAPADIVKQIQNLMGSVTQDSPTQQFDYNYKFAGRGYWISFISTGIFDSTGKLIEFQVAGRDITFRKELEKKLEVTINENKILHEKYSIIADFTRDMERWVDPEGKLLYVSSSCEQITGYNADEFYKADDLMGMIVIPEDRDRWNSRIKDFLELTDIPESEFRIRRKDGAVVTLSVMARNVVDHKGRFLGIRSSYRDISDRKRTEQALKQALEEINSLQKKLKDENVYLRGISEPNLQQKGLISRSGTMMAIIDRVRQTCEEVTPVLIRGEVGSGKKYLAKLIHQLSPRGAKSLITFNCNSHSPQNIMDVLFGGYGIDHEGRRTSSIGLLELAEDSSILMEEITSLQPDIQQKIAALLSTGCYRRAGGQNDVKANVRLLATTNSNLEDLVINGLFDRELFQLLNQSTYTVPPLRERPEDILLLAWQFLVELEITTGKRIDNLSAEMMEFLLSYSWPGNLHEMRSILETSVIMSSGTTLELKMPQSRRDKSGWQSLSEVEKAYIEEVLRFTNGKIRGKGGAAEILGLNESTLRFRMKKLSTRMP